MEPLVGIARFPAFVSRAFRDVVIGLQLAEDKSSRKRFANENDIAWRCRTIGFEEGVIIRSTLGRMIMAPALIARREEIDELVGTTLKAVDRTAREYGRL